MRTSLAFLLAIGAASAWAACSATSEGSRVGSGGGGAAGAGGGSAGDGGQTDGGGTGGGFEGGLLDFNAEPCSPTCSADGKKVLPCSGDPVECQAPLTCSAGQCKDACQAAKDQKSSVGCEYFAVYMEGIGGADGGCFTVFVANTSSAAAHFQIAFGGAPLDLGAYAKIPQGSGQSLQYGAYDPAAGLAPSQVAIVFLGGGPGGGVQCPVPAAVKSGAQTKGTGLGQAFRIVSDVPVVAYQMLPYGGGSAAVTGASLLLPTSAWDLNYVAANAFKKSQAANTSPSMNIVAAQDGTTVNILPKSAIVGGSGVQGSPANTPVAYSLSAGQVLQFTQPEELTGSPVLSDKPIGLWAGHACLNVPADKAFCDHAEQQIPPVRALGSEYVGASYRDRIPPKPENRLWRLIGAVDGTLLAFDPPVSGAPSTVGLGTVAEFNTDQPFVVKSQDDKHPFILVTYMAGSTTVQSGYGDADFVRIVPAAQYMNRYVFFTDPTYPETNLVVVRKKGTSGFSDVELDCAGTLGGWTAVGGSGAYEMTRTDLVRHDFQPQGPCNNGRHEMKSKGAFGLWVWGWGTPETKTFTENVSYGYPAGENVVPINDVKIPPVPK